VVVLVVVDQVVLMVEETQVMTQMFQVVIMVEVLDQTTLGVLMVV
tara:strand:- start:247 stop:381 length:135 start_codon:yes stop_codon:yes gene_type:complete